MVGNGKGVIFKMSLSKMLANKNKNKNNNSGVTWDANTDYQAIINDAVAKGDYTAAAQAEQSRNAKIQATGSNYATTNNYSSYLNNAGTGASGGSGSKNSPYTQYTPVGTYNDAGLPSSALSKINDYKTQYNNAIANGDTAAADAAHRAAEYIRQQYGYSGGEDGSEYIALPNEVYLPTQSSSQFVYSTPQPTYNGGKYDSQINELLSQILNRDDFSYDVEADPLYQQYSQMYQREGDRAMRDTMAEAAASAGGMNSYAITAAQQANNYYGAQLNDKIPELYQLAYDMYLADKESKVQDLGILQNLDATQYNRYRDTMSDWQNDRNFAYNMYRDDISDAQWNQTFDYNKYVDDRNFAYDSDWQNKEWDYNVGRDEIADSRYEQETALENSRYDTETAKEEVWKLISLGVTPSADLLARAGMSETDVSLAVAAVQAENNKVRTTSSTKKSIEEEEEEEEEETTGANKEYYNGSNLPDDDGVVISGVKIPNSALANIMSEQEWYSRRGSHQMSGSGGVEVAEYNTYEEYYKAMMEYLTEKYSEN